MCISFTGDSRSTDDKGTARKEVYYVIDSGHGHCRNVTCVLKPICNCVIFSFAPLQHGIRPAMRTMTRRSDSQPLASVGPSLNVYDPSFCSLSAALALARPIGGSWLSASVTDHSH